MYDAEPRKLYESTACRRNCSNARYRRPVDCSVTEIISGLKPGGGSWLLCTRLKRNPASSSTRLVQGEVHSVCATRMTGCGRHVPASGDDVAVTSAGHGLSRCSCHVSPTLCLWAACH